MASILCLNSGSSSLKFALFDVTAGALRRLIDGVINGIGALGTQFRMREIGGDREEVTADAVSSYARAAALVLDRFDRRGIAFTAAGHRLVHGGPHHLAPVRIDGSILEAFEQAIPFAPLHLPAAIECIEAVAARHPALPQVACFDTAFHATLPLLAQRLPLPTFLWDAGIRRYGFHGLSYEYVTGALGALLGARAIIAHLGNGASMVALRDGAPVDTTMGLTPAGGLVMATRPGDLDPGVLLHLIRVHRLDADGIEEVVNHRSGLVGLSETTSDMQALLAARSSDPRADLAVTTFCYSARKWIGALSATLGGLDTLVFTGGIGEHSAAIREEICRELRDFGIALDARRNADSEAIVSSDDSRCVVRVIPTDEDLVIARHTSRLLSAGV